MWKPITAVLALLMTSSLSAQVAWIGDIKGTNTDLIREVATDANGNTIVVGTFNGTCDFDTGPGVFALTTAGGNDGFVAKYDPQGALLWAGSIGGPGHDHILTVSVAVDGIFIGGWSTQNADLDPTTGVSMHDAGSERDGFFARLATDGSFVFAAPLVGPRSVELLDLEVSPANGDVIVTGGFTDEVEMDPFGSGDTLESDELGPNFYCNRAFMARYTATGDLVWAERMGGPGIATTLDVHVKGNGDEVIRWGTCGIDVPSMTTDMDPGPGDVDPTDNGNLPSTDWMFLGEFDDAGSLLWHEWMRRYQSGSEVPDDYIYAIASDANDNVIIAGTFRFTFTEYPVNNISLSIFGVTNEDGFLIKFDPDGDLLWEKHMGSTNITNDEALTGLVVDAQGNYWVSGIFSDGAEMDSGDLGHLFQSNAENDIAVIGFTPDGIYLGHGGVGGSWYDANPKLAWNNGNLLLAGSYGVSNADLDITTAVQLFQADGDYDAFITLFAPEELMTTTSIAENEVAMGVYPNPCTDKLFVHGCGRYEVRDMAGRTVQSGTLRPGEALTTASLLPGTYFLRSSGAPTGVRFVKVP